MPRRRRTTSNSSPDGRAPDGSGRFGSGNAGGAQIEVLPGFDIDTAAPWMLPHLRRAQRRYNGARKSGLFKRTGSRLDGMLRAAVLADAHSEAFTAYAVTLATPADAKPWLDDARAVAREARTAWSKLTSLVGLKYERGGSGDPLAALAREMGGGDD